MELVRQNAYHIIGILAGTNQRTIVKQKAKIGAFQKVGKKIQFETDLEVIGSPNRSDDEITKAFSSIEKNENRLQSALFWFINNNHLDETALSYLQSGDIVKAEEIWVKVTSGKDVSSKNFTAFNNLGSLKLAISFANRSIDMGNLKEAVRLKTELLTSSSFTNFCQLVVDETYSISKDKELERFVNAILEELDKSKNAEAKKIPANISSIHPKIKSLVSEKLSDEPLHNIERKTERTKKARNENPEDGLKLARKLYRDTKEDLTTLSELLGKTDLKYKMVADKLAKELIQCGIDYFTEYQEKEDLHEGDLGHDVMKFFKYVRSIAIGTYTKDRLEENIEGLQEWIDSTEERKKQKIVAEDVAFIFMKLEQFQRMHATVENADHLVITCKPKLQYIRNVLGNYNDHYLKISSTVVNNAQGMLVTVVNNAQEDPSLQLGSLDRLSNTLKSAIKVSNKLDAFDMYPELKNRYTENHRILKSFNSQIESHQRSSNSSSDGCYIATMAYGSYDHPQVIKLRRFRDQTLRKNSFGRGFISIYYYLSPSLVLLLNGNVYINSIIRKLLNKIVKHIL